MSADQSKRIWQSQACPDWCVQPHSELAAPVNRECASDPIAPDMPPGVRLTLAQAENDDRRGVHLTTINVTLSQWPREVEPRVLLSSRQHGVVEMTLNEAESLRALIGETVDAARRAMKEDDQ